MIEEAYHLSGLSSLYILCPIMLKESTVITPELCFLSNYRVFVSEIRDSIKKSVEELISELSA